MPLKVQVLLQFHHTLSDLILFVEDSLESLLAERFTPLSQRSKVPLIRPSTRKHHALTAMVKYLARAELRDLPFFAFFFTFKDYPRRLKLHSLFPFVIRTCFCPTVTLLTYIFLQSQCHLDSY